jgi:glutathione S-transferase
VTLRLHLSRRSGNAYKVRILLEQLGLPYETVFLDLGRHEQKSDAFRELSPRGQVPVLEDGPVVVWDSSACLVYLARKHGREDWLPIDPVGLAAVIQWMALAGTELQFGLQYARRGTSTGRWIAGTLEQLQAVGRLGLEAMQRRLSNHDWLAAGHVTIADIACFPYTETAPEALVPLDDYPAVAAWVERCRSMPNWAERLDR